MTESERVPLSQPAPESKPEPLSRRAILAKTFPEVFRRTALSDSVSCHDLYAELVQAGHKADKDTLVELIGTALWACEQNKIVHPRSWMIKMGLLSTPESYFLRVRSALKNNPTNRIFESTVPPGPFLTPEEVRKAARGTLDMLAAKNKPPDSPALPEPQSDDLIGDEPPF